MSFLVSVLRTRRDLVRPLVAAVFVLLGAGGPAAATPLVVYDDALRNEFQDWSWATHDLAQTAVVHAGSHAISMQARNWEGLYFHRDAGVETATLDTLTCWVHGGSAGGQTIRIVLMAGGGEIAGGDLRAFVSGGMIPAGSWAQAVVPLEELGAGGAIIDGLIFQAFAAEDQGTIYFDDLSFDGTPAPPAPVTVQVDPNLDRRPIDPLIYGISFGSTQELAELPYPIRRWGGNAVTRYSWELDTSNRASDWFFMNIPNDNAHPEDLPDGSASDVFVQESRDVGADVLLTVPLIGWTPRDRSKRWGFSVQKYGPQELDECRATGNPPWCTADAGNGVAPGGQWITGNDPADTSVPIGPTYVRDWMLHLQATFGAADAGGVRFYALDNEPMLWSSTHRDVHPDPVGYDELWNRTRDYAETIRATDPAAAIGGPAVWGWCAYFHSAVDGCTPGGDQASHGGLGLLEWYLAQIEAYRQTHGVRLVDYLDVHYYPQAAGVALDDDESAAVAARRLRSVKSLYDPNYVDESWIGQPVELIPRLRRWIDERCPGTLLAVTEYNWGGDDGISSALAQAEVLAVFGREGVDLATRWVAPTAGSRVADAFRMFLDYDGAGSRVEGESVRALSSDVDAVGAYSVRTPGGDLLVFLFNKATTATEVTVSVTGGLESDLDVYRLDETHPYGFLETVVGDGTGFVLALPARSATLVQGTPAVSDTAESDLPATRPLLVQARPSPFVHETDIVYRLREAGAVHVTVHDLAGRQVRDLWDDEQRPGRHQLRWDGRDGDGRSVPAGMYFVRVATPGESASAQVLRLGATGR
ncbi:MAG: glycoside hydrolase family 44 protein [Candidatus Eisenbacteria bacterium]|uniref:Glycoside hydrolase family 44 domain-containing protein n=1 Tax=Eiseniibacteriota bacterium TaxID=2212470 RepID=A0A956M1U6_UNCEI|nr:hypothetical protein [Candidatus Eisenbacteria bacterium]